MKIDFSHVVDALPGLVWTAYPDGRADFVNRRWCEYTGLTVDEARGDGWQGAVHPSDRLQLVERWIAFTRAGEGGELEARLRRFDGEYRWFLFRFSPLADASGEITTWCGINTDIEDRKRAEEAQRALDQRAQGILDGLPAHVIFMTPEGELEDANRFSLSYFGKTLEELKALKVGHSYHPDDRARVLACWRQSVETGQPCNFEARSRRADGAYRWLHTVGFPLRSSEGRILVWYILSLDVTERKLSEEALTRARLELADMARVTSLGALTASIAHEVNQPLSGITTNASTCLRMLASDTPNLEGARETARRTLRDGERATDVIQRLRTLFAKHDRPIESVDLTEAAREVIALSASELSRRRATLEEKFDRDLPRVTGDRVQLQQVILNLIVNGADAMSTVEDGRRHIVIRTARDGADHVRLSVQDAGVGLQGQDPEKLFQAFYTTKEGGMGIGLFVSRSIVERHGGRLWAAPNEVGSGATFAFSLPRTQVTV